MRLWSQRRIALGQLGGAALARESGVKRRLSVRGGPVAAGGACPLRPSGFPPRRPNMHDSTQTRRIAIPDKPHVRELFSLLRSITYPLLKHRTLSVLGSSLVAVLTVGTTTLAIAASDPSATIVDFAFQPATITVNPGDSVTWTNMGAVAHTTT